MVLREAGGTQDPDASLQGLNRVRAEGRSSSCEVLRKCTVVLEDLSVWDVYDQDFSLERGPGIHRDYSPYFITTISEI